MSAEAIEMIQKELENGEVEELFLDGIKIEKINDDLQKELQKLDELICLSLNDCGLVSLINLPKKESLIRLELMENKFAARELEHLSALTGLQSLSLGANRIEKLEDLEPLKRLEELVQLDLSETGVSKIEDYRKRVFEFLPKLQILDNCDATGNEYAYSSSDEDAEGDEEEEDEDEEGELENGEDSEYGDEDDEDEEEAEEEEEDDEEPAKPKKVKK